MNITALPYDRNVIFVACSDAPHKSNFGEKNQFRRSDESNEGGIFHA
jgi:hypothetical protein